MQFADPAVAIAVKKVLGHDEIDAAQLGAVRELYITGAASLADLPRFANLYRLYIRESALKDGEILSTLTQLTELSLGNVSGVKSEHIATLTWLKDLSVCDCGQWTLQPLAGLTRLRLLTLHNLGIEDLTPLKGMTRLELVSLWGNPIRDVSVFKGMKHLHRLSLDWENLADRQALADKRVSAALESLEYADFPENAPSAPQKAGKRNKSMPRLEYLADVHSRVYFCRDAALVRLKGGLDKLACRDYGVRKKEKYDLYLDGVPLVETHIPGCRTCGTRLWAGYGDGLINQQACQAVRDSQNAEYTGLKNAVDSLAPLVGLMKSGWYVIADFDLFPVQNYGVKFDYFWDVPEYTTELHFHHAWPGTQLLDAPMFLAPSQRAAQMNPERLEYYRQRLKESDSFPRAVALYLNGGVALLLDGHHKAAACAAEGVPVKTTVIFPIEDGKKLEAALSDGRRLYFHHARSWNLHSSGPLILRNGQGEDLTRVSCLQRMRKKHVFTEPMDDVEWGRVPDEYRTAKFSDYPNPAQLIYGTLLPPDQIRSLIESEMKKEKGSHDMTAIEQLRSYAALFPDSKWLSASERAWLNRPYEDFFIKMAFELLPEE